MSQEKTASSLNRNEIKVSAEGVAKLTFNFLEELQCDSSLEPGEVKTPPHTGCSPVSQRSHSPAIRAKNISSLALEYSSTSEVAENRDATKIDDGKIKTVTKSIVKSASQLEAEACEEKVRAILELDAIKQREEKQKRKELRRQSLEKPEDEEAKRKAKEERKRLKRLKKEQEAAESARRAALGEENDVDDGEIEDDDTDDTSILLKKSNKHLKELEEEERASFEDLRSVIKPATGVRYPPPNTMYEHFGNFRPINPFMRGPRPDFHAGRGGFMHRGRGNLRCMRFQGNFVRGPPFYGGLPPQMRHMASHMQRPHTPPPARGHSPIQPPNADLHWTKATPSISYAFNNPDYHGINKSLVDQHRDSVKEHSLEPTENSLESRKKSKKPKHLKHKKQKHTKKSKKLEERKKSKKRNKKMKEKSKKQSKRKAQKMSPNETIMKKPNTASCTTDEAENKDGETATDIPTAKKIKLSSLLREIEEPTVLETEEWQLAKIKKEKFDEYEMRIKEITPPLQLSKDAISIKKENENENKEKNSANTEKIEIAEKTAIEQNNDNNTNSETKKDDAFDMFADSPLPLVAAQKPSKSTETPKSVHTTIAADEPTTPPRPNTILEETNTPPPSAQIQNLLRRSQTPPLPSSVILNINEKPPEKAALLTKAIEIKQRINKLLEEDDIQLESTIAAHKERLREKTLKHASDIKSSSKVSSSKDKEGDSNKKQKRSQDAFEKNLQTKERETKIEVSQVSFSKSKTRSRSRTPARTDYKRQDIYGKKSSVEHHNNKYSASRRSRSRSFDRNKKDKNRFDLNRSSSRGSSSKNESLHENKSKSKSRTREISGLNRSHSTERDQKDAKRLQQNPFRKPNESKSNETKIIDKKDKTKSSGQKRDRDSRSKTPPPKRTITETKKSLKKSQKPLSFTAAEFLFPEECDDDYVLDVATPPAQHKSKTSPVFNDEDTVSSSMNTADDEDAYGEIKNTSASPDTDDYMDNWEDEDPDMDQNSALVGFSSTPMNYHTQEEDDAFVAKYVNPSPPTKEKQYVSNHKKDANSISSTPVSTPPKQLTPKETETKEVTVNASMQQNVPENKQLFGMQEIYDQFIKSVEQSGVSLASDKVEPNSKEKLSNSSTSNSSTSSSSSSSSSEDSSSSSGSSSENENETNKKQSKKKKKKYASKKKTKTSKIAPQAEIKPSLETSNELIIPTASELPPEPNELIINSEPASPPRSQPIVSLSAVNTPPPNVQSKPSSAPSTPAVKTPKSNVAKDFKKLKNLETNLARIQLMRENYDSADEISEELLKMEKLFLQEKNAILQKYAKSPSTTNAATEASSTPPRPPAQQTENVPQTEQAIPNKIFDSNREAIKLTISPIKLPQKSIIFKENELVAPKEETDFTEKLVSKPVKEIAIVKPMMESKEPQRSSHSKHRRSSPSHQSVSRAPRSPRSPRSSRSPQPATSYRDRSRRSHSRGRQNSPHRRGGRIRSLSISPSRRGTGRHASPFGSSRRGANNSNIRYRGNRRSRSRSLSRYTSRRGDSPRRRQPRNFNSYRKSRRDSSRSKSPRPHSPASPPPSSHDNYRRSNSRERFSRSPLPFKPPSPPERCSESRSISRSPLPRRPRSPSTSPPTSRSPQPKHYKRRSSSVERQFYGQESNISGTTSSSYYYNVSPNRISVDARFNIVLNTPGAANQEVAASFENFSSYAQYGDGAYMPIPETGNYYSHQYVDMLPRVESAQNAQQPVQEVYSNIPIINSIPNEANAMSNFYYNEFAAMIPHTNNSVLKELPKAETMVVQKGNVLEIVPSNELPVTVSTNTTANQNVAVEEPKSCPAVSWKEEVNNRHVTAAVLRLSRENESGIMRSILKKSEQATEVKKEEKPSKKKVYFEDGIYPNKDSEDEDLQIIETKIRRKLKRLRKRNTISEAAQQFIDSDKKSQSKRKIDPALEKLPAPAPPLGAPPAHVEQPIYLRPPTPTPFFFFHFDAVVHSMYVSQLERPIPPRLLNSKCLPPHIAKNAAINQQSPANIGSPGGSGMSTSSANIKCKKEIGSIAAFNRVAVDRRVERTCSPRSTGSPMEIQPALNMHANEMQNFHANSFQSNFAAGSMPNIAVATRQNSPIGFTGMRIQNFMRLPPSPLIRNMHAAQADVRSPNPSIPPMRHAYNTPPPNMMTANDFHSSNNASQHFGNYPANCNAHIRQTNPFASPHQHSAHLTQLNFNVRPPMHHHANSHQHPHHMHSQRPPPNFYMPVRLTAPMDMVSQQSPRAMITPFMKKN